MISYNYRVRVRDDIMNAHQVGSQLECDQSEGWESLSITTVRPRETFQDDLVVDYHVLHRRAWEDLPGDAAATPAPPSRAEDDASPTLEQPPFLRGDRPV